MHWIGTSGFQYPEWKGKFYPADLSAAKMLSFYAEQFGSTEVNYTFRRILSEKALLNWAAATPTQFKFSFKAPQRITHFARLVNCADTLNFFVESLGPMKRRLGVVLFQLPPQFKKDADRLSVFLQILPRRLKVAFEFRHASWFDDEIYGMLRRHKAALCIAESEDLKTPAISTAKFGYLRLRREDYTRAKLKEWAKFIGRQAQWSEAYIYFKHEKRAVGPKFAKQMQALLEKV